MNGFFHAAVIYFIPMWIYYESGIISQNGKNSDLWTISLTSFVSQVFTVTLDLIIFTRNHTVVNWIAIGLCFGFAVPGCLWMSNFIDFTSYTDIVLMNHLTPIFYMTCFLCITINSLVGIATHSFKVLLNPNPTDFLMQC